MGDRGWNLKMVGLVLILAFALSAVAADVGTGGLIPREVQSEVSDSGLRRHKRDARRSNWRRRDIVVRPSSVRFLFELVTSGGCRLIDLEVLLSRPSSPTLLPFHRRLPLLG